MSTNLYILAPLKVYGSGKYTLSDVMEIDGTAKYLKVAEETGKCQNQETQEYCLAKEYLAKGMEQCSCTPYKLRNYAKKVRSNKQLMIKDRGLIN